MIKRGAFSLAEILVASGVFITIAACLVFLYHMGLATRARHEAHQRPHRAALQCISYVRNELRVIQLLEPSAYEGNPAPASEVLYRRTAFGGPLQVDGSGTPLWTETCRLSFEADHKLWRRPDNPNQPARALANLGPGGHVRFSRVNDQLLQVDLRADFGDPKAVIELTQRILLPNQP